MRITYIYDTEIIISHKEEPHGLDTVNQDGVGMMVYNGNRAADS